MDQIQEIEAFIEDRWSSASLNSGEDYSEMTFFSFLLSFLKFVLYIYYYNFLLLDDTSLYCIHTPLC